MTLFLAKQTFALHVLAAVKQNKLNNFKQNKMAKKQKNAASSTQTATKQAETIKTEIAEPATSAEQPKQQQAAQPKSKKAAAKKAPEVPRGMPKSRRPWKTPKTKFATIKKTVHRLSFEKKMELRNQMRHIKEVSRSIKEQRKEDALLKHQRRVLNAERRLANERRSEVVQVIKNPAKLKRMKRKHMRMIEKRDLSQVKVV